MTDHWDMLTPNGGPRFYPPGQHPALAPLIEQRCQCVRLIVRSPGANEDAVRLLDYCNKQIAIFEAGESEAKANAYARARASE